MDQDASKPGPSGNPFAGMDLDVDSIVDRPDVGETLGSSPEHSTPAPRNTRKNATKSTSGGGPREGGRSRSIKRTKNSPQSKTGKKARDSSAASIMSVEAEEESTSATGDPFARMREFRDGQG